MFNALLWFGFLFFQLSLAWVFLRFFGKIGLYVLFTLVLVLVNLQVQKLITLFGLEATLGNASYALTFLITDYISETEGKRAAQRAVWLGLLLQLTSMLIMQLALSFHANSNDTAQMHLDALFAPLPQLLMASLLAYLLSQWHDVHAYHYWRQLLPARRWLWLRNNLSTLVSQLIDTTIFVFIAFGFGALAQPLTVILQILISTYLLKALAALCDTPFLYLMTRLSLSHKQPT